MISAPLPENEAERLAALKRYEILDSITEQSYDDLLAIAAGICGTSMGAVSLIDAQRQWFKANKNLPAPETSRDVAFCAHAILGDEVFVVPDATADHRFHDNPLVTGNPNIRFYAGAPLRVSSGHAVGTLCVIDDRPHELTEFQRQALESLSRQVVVMLEMRMAHKELRMHLSEREWYERELQQREQELIARNAELVEMSRTDALTGLPNRRVFTASAEHAVAEGASGSRPLALAIADVDHFKTINDVLGHPAGDRVLVSVAQSLRAWCPPGATIARFGGEEFAIVLPDSDLMEAARCCDALRLAVQAVPREMPVTISIGLTGFRMGDTVSDLYARADQALYAAKHGGRNRVETIA